VSGKYLPVPATHDVCRMHINYQRKTFLGYSERNANLIQNN